MPHGYLALGVQRGVGGSRRQWGAKGRRGRVGLQQAVSMPPEEGLARAQEDGHSREPVLP